MRTDVSDELRRFTKLPFITGLPQTKPHFDGE